MTDKHTKLPEHLWVSSEIESLIKAAHADKNHPSRPDVSYTRSDIVDAQTALIRELVDALDDARGWMVPNDLDDIAAQELIQKARAFIGEGK